STTSRAATADAWVSTTTMPRSPPIAVTLRSYHGWRSTQTRSAISSKPTAASLGGSAQPFVELGPEQLAEVGSAACGAGEAQLVPVGAGGVGPPRHAAVGAQAAQLDAEQVAEPGAGAGGQRAAQLVLVALVGVLHGPLEEAAVEVVVGG